MNIALISVTSSFNHLAKKLENYSCIQKICHYGANEKLLSTEKYLPIPYQIPYDRLISDSEIIQLATSIISHKINLVLTSHLTISQNALMHTMLKKNGIDYFFVDPNISRIETDRLMTKKFLKSINIPTSEAKSISSLELYTNFYNYELPFVIKLNRFMHGRQTFIVEEENQTEVFLDLFSIYTDYTSRITNIGLADTLIIEEFVDIKEELSYIAMINKQGWEYFGSAKDYKKSFDGDLGHNTIGMGAINLADIDRKIHQYMEKIYYGIQEHLSKKNQYYKGFIFLNIAITQCGDPVILEINARAGEPEIDVIIESIENNLLELFWMASRDEKIPKIERNHSKVCAVRIVNKNFNWYKKTLYLPDFTYNSEIDVHLHGSDSSNLYHSLIVCKGNTHVEASSKIYRYLDNQDLRGYYYRKDIGLEL